MFSFVCPNVDCRWCKTSFKKNLKTNEPFHFPLFFVSHCLLFTSFFTVDALPCFLSAYALKVTRFNVPSEMLTTHPGQLICEFEISRGERLYSLRWYLNDIEFFRFEPRADQRVQLFPLPQLRLDVSESIKNSIISNWPLCVYPDTNEHLILLLK